MTKNRRIAADLAERLAEKRLSFASDEQLEELLHVPAGTVTPFGLRLMVKSGFR